MQAVKESPRKVRLCMIWYSESKKESEATEDRKNKDS